MKKVTLFINSSSSEKIKVGIQINGKKETIEREIDTRRAQAVLPMIDELLKKNKIKVSDLTSIEVFEGPGSYTGLRVGIAIANALAFSLKIRVNGKKVGKFVEPLYE